MRAVVDVPLTGPLSNEISPPSFRETFRLAPDEVAASRCLRLRQHGIRPQMAGVYPPKQR
jgi:hypothetical protein